MFQLIEKSLKVHEGIIIIGDLRGVGVCEREKERESEGERE